MKFLRKLFFRPVTLCTVEYKERRNWSIVVLNVPFKKVPALNDVLKFRGRKWMVTQVETTDSVPRIEALVLP